MRGEAGEAILEDFDKMESVKSKNSDESGRRPDGLLLLRSLMTLTILMVGEV